MDTQELVCVACGQANPTAFSFCGACGANLESVCPSCGAPTSRGLAFCGRCGVGLGEPAKVAGRLGAGQPRTRAPENINTGLESAAEERKVVTVLYADLVASTELATQLDPEELRAILGPFFETMADEIARHGGTVEKYIGDAIVAVFGHPVAHEDDAERAVRAALAMQARLVRDPRFSYGTEGRLAMRIGVNTGDVLAGPASDRGGAVTGDAISLAARIQSLAPAGSVVAADRTRRLTRRAFAYRDLGEATLKGVDHPIPVWEILPDLEPSVEPSDLRSVMVGRDGELVLLRALFDRTIRARAPTLVTLLGPPGIGKSRLAHEFAASVPDARVVRGRCLPYGDGVAYWALAEILKSEAGILDSDPPETIAAKATGRLDQRFVGTDEAFRTTEVLLSSIGVALRSDPLVGLEPAVARRAIAAAWRRYFESISTEGPVVALIEDIHWAEASLLDLLESVAGSVSGPVLLVCTARPEVWERRPSWGAAVANANTMALAPLSGADGIELIHRLLAGDGPPEIVERVLQQSEGNPFYVGELLRMMVDDGTLEHSTGGGWRATRSLPSALPDTVQGVIASRLDLLTRAGKRAIQDASVVGRVFWLGVLARLGPGEALAATDELVDKGLVVERDGSAIEGERELMFNHILIRDVAYASIPRARRVEAHAIVLDWIDQVTGGRDEEFAEILSHHASEAGDLERSARFAMLAGYRHRRVYDADEAIRWYDRALDALDRHGSEPAALVRFETLLARGEAYEQLGRFAEARSGIGQALEVARLRSTGSREWLESRALAALVQVDWSAGWLDEAEALLPQALEAAVDQGADDLVARLSSGAGSTALLRGDPISAIALHERALAVATEAEDREGEAVARHGLAEAALAVGPFDDGLDQARKADELLRRLGQTPLVHRNERLIGLLMWVTGQRDQAIDVAHAAVAGCRAVGSRRDLVSALATYGFLASSTGELGPAIRSTEEAALLAGQLGSSAVATETSVWRSVVLAELGDIRPLADEIAIGLERTAATEERVHRGPLLAARGWMEAADGDPERALATFDEASAAVAGMRFPAFLAGRLMLLAGTSVDSTEIVALAANRIALAASNDGPPLQAWARFGAGLAAMHRGDIAVAENETRLALATALAVGEMPIVWRSGALLADALDALGRRVDAVAVRRDAASALSPVIAGLGDADLRSTFAGRSDVSSVIQPAGQPTQV